MELDNNSNTSIIHQEKMFVNECTENDDKITLFIPQIFIDDFEIIKVYLRNIKTRNEYPCHFIKNKNKSLTIELSKLSSFFTDYEGAINIVIKSKKIC